MLHPEPTKENTTTTTTTTGPTTKNGKWKPSDDFDESPTHNLYIGLILLSV